MDRLSLDEETVTNMRAAIIAANATLEGPWDGPEDDPTRTGDVCPGSPLKIDDDVLANGDSYRVLCPSVGRDRFMAFGITGWGPTTTSLALSEVTDRAPLDANETPMPVIPPELEALLSERAAASSAQE